MILDRLLDLEKNPLALRYNESEYDLEGFRRWLAELGSPQDGQTFVHIAGTKGKGSTGVMIEGLLRGLGFSTAFYSSPHLKHFGERFRFDGIPWTFEEFEAALERLVEGLPPQHRQVLDAPHQFRTVFEFLTLLALVEFRKRPGRIVVWETGLGGRLDCTNVVDPAVCVITALGLDHTAVLGKEIEQIAAEKAGIIKPGRPVVVSRQYPEFMDRVLPVITRRAAEVGAPIVPAWECCPVLEARPLFGGQMVRMRLPDAGEDEVFLPLNGVFQRNNLEAAVAATWLTTRSTIRLQGLEQVRWHGRLEIHLTPTGQALILDGAHCPLSAGTLLRSLREWQDEIPLPCRPPYEVLWGMQRDKEHRDFLRGLDEGAPREYLGTLHCYPVSGPRGADSESLANISREAGYETQAHVDVASALDAALATGRSVIALGTLYTISTLRDLWSARTRRLRQTSSGASGS